MTPESLMHIGYALLLMVLVFMIWVSMIESREIDTFNHPPCPFNPLCSCSKAGPDLGTVQCRFVPFPAIPRTVNNSKVFSLHMEHTGLMNLEPHFLQSTGLYKLEVCHNLLTHVPDDSFFGLERSLRELILHHNELIEIPSRAVRHLQKLQILDLSGNQISCIEIDSFKGLEDSLQTLYLSQNSLNSLPQDCFTSLPMLDTIDLSGNNLKKIDANVFRDGMPRLSKLLLSDNLIPEIPYLPLAPLKMLRVLDLSHNLIYKVQPDDIMDTTTTPSKTNVKLTLDKLHLEYNMIEMLPKSSFQNFDILNNTYLDGNPLEILEDEAFRQAKIRELYIRHCKLYMVSPLAFEGLGGTLQKLDLSGNNITSLPENIFNKFDTLRVLHLRDNKIQNLIPTELFNGFQNTLLRLDLSGDKNAVVNLQDLRRMRNMLSLSVTKLSSSSLAPDDFIEYGVQLEVLKITRSSLTTIKSHAFTHVRGIKQIDFSDNSIATIENDAFTEIGHSLVSLKISHGLGTMSSFPSEAFRHLTSLEELDLSNNKLKQLSDISFHFLKKLRTLQLYDNNIEQVLKGTFQGDIHSKLETIYLNYNNLKQIAQHTFVDLEALHKLRLDDNRIEKIEKRAFMNLYLLRHLNLRGNKVTSISDEAFQNLPELEVLDIAYNALTTFDFNYFDQVGTLSSLKVNVSHNQIFELTDVNTGYGSSRGDHGTMYHSNIKILDLSHNNISRISPGFFRPAEISLTHLHLGHNSIINTTRDIFGNMPHLQWLDLSYNEISELDYDTFKYSRKLQVLFINNNELLDVPIDVFKTVHDLRIVDMSHNHLRSLPDNLFPDDGMETLNMSHNYLSKIPVAALSNLAALTICEIDLSHNRIASIHQMDLSNKFRSLSKLDLSNNFLFRLDDAAFATLPRLSVLDLSHNDDLKVMDKAFVGLENHLIKLGLNNISLITVPELPLPFLRVLEISNNDLPTIPQEFAPNMSALRVLDISKNDLTNVPLVTLSLPQLRSLSLGGNSITTLTNTSFLRISEKLEHLDISHLKLNTFEFGALSKMRYLRSLRISPYTKVKDFNIPNLIQDMHNLRDLWIEAPKPYSAAMDMAAPMKGSPMSSTSPSSSSHTDLHKEMDGELPFKLRRVTFGGQDFTHLSDNVLNGIQSPFLNIIFYNTSISNLPQNFFTNLRHTQNISIDFRYSNNKLSNIPNPNTAFKPHLPNQLFLTNLKLEGNTLNCECGIGWIEFWKRKARQYICTSQPWTETEYTTSIHTTISDIPHKQCCDEYDDDLRETYCVNKQNRRLLDVLKEDLECGWGSGAVTHIPGYSNLELTIAIILTSVFFIIWI